MAKEIIMPRFGMTQEEATIVQWIVKEGEFVEQGDPIAEVTTDKVNMEVEAPRTGYLGGLLFSEGDTVPVTTIIAYILEEGEAPPAAPAPQAQPVAQPQPAAQTQAASSAPSSVTPVARRVAESAGVDLSQVQGSGSGGKVTRDDVEKFISTLEGSDQANGAAVPAPGKPAATPAARRTAQEQGIDLGSLSGSGPQGRIQAADVLAAAQQALTVQQPARVEPVAAQPVMDVPPGAQIIPLEGMRRTIARRLQASYQEAPHIMFTVEVDMTGAIAFREFANARLPEGQSKISMTAIIVKACAWALRQHPLMNSHLINEQIVVMPQVNLGIAVALDGGLIVPVLHDADLKGVRQIGDEVNDLASRARQNKLRGEDISGGTFTISNLGMYGIKNFTAILNPPEVGILAVGAVEKRFVPDENDQPVARPLMGMTLSADHRVVDGAQAAQFITALRGALEQPQSILL